MPLAAGARIGIYEIIALLGAGGMGEVYRARDTRLGRDVAIKVLPASVGHDPERLARFEREARVLATLNHPHIGAIYGVEESDGLVALVLELIDGEPLSVALQRAGTRGLPAAQAFRIADQIADALDAAHERGIVHRDLKPANIAVAPDGNVKVLDFGLAKAETGDPDAIGLTHSPTVIGPTIDGVLLGTAPYMSPEQARGKPVDKRTDIWAFGCVLFEMLTGRRTFPGETTTDTIAAIIERDPDWTAVPVATPPAVRRLIERCLEKDPRRRLRDIADARADLDAARTAMPTPERPRQISRSAVVALAAAVVAGLAVPAWLLRPEAPARPRPIEFTFGPADDGSFDPTAPIPSPDGAHVAFFARASSGEHLLWVRDVESTIARRLAAIDDPVTPTPPFWSPDSRWIAFFTQGKLRKISLSGGPPLTICASPGVLGGTWNRDNVIVFAPSNRGVLHRVPAAGGTSEPITTLSAERNENSHRWPRFLPDGRHFLFTARSDVIQNNIVYVGSLDARELRPLTAAQSNAAYAAGHLLFAREGTLLAQRFDPATLSLSGEPFAVVPGVLQNTPSSQAGFGVSDDGSLLAYRAGERVMSQLTWLDRAGRQTATVGAAREIMDVRLAPNGKTAAVVIPDPDSGNRDIWLVDLATGTMTRFTSHPANDWQMAWSPDSRRLAFASDRNGASSIYVKPLDAGDETLLLRVPGRGAFPKDWAQDGRLMTINLDTAGTGVPTMHALPLVGDRQPFPIGSGANDREDDAMLRSDGKAVAFTARQAGVDDVYVAAFPAGSRRRVSTNGGGSPRWKADGREVYYVAPDGSIMGAPIGGPDGLEPGVAVRLLRPCGGIPIPAGAHSYDAAADGSRFLTICRVPSSTPPLITVSMNWTASLK